ncbi:hypothetical protein Scep_001163 [Stephania cephalantha]|uniref:Uncharacterized protein n=1 Tax=Stephania cephalantha TaxID=152367 RepID=A0AAP0L7E5_9MAGN
MHSRHQIDVVSLGFRRSLAEGEGRFERESRLNDWVIGEGPARGLATNDGDVEEGKRDYGWEGDREVGTVEARRRTRRARGAGGKARTAEGSVGQRERERPGRWSARQIQRHCARDSGGRTWRGTATREARDAQGERGRGRDGRIADLGEREAMGKKSKQDEGFGWFKVAWKS